MRCIVKREVSRLRSTRTRHSLLAVKKLKYLFTLLVDGWLYGSYEARFYLHEFPNTCWHRMQASSEVQIQRPTY